MSDAVVRICAGGESPDVGVEAAGVPVSPPQAVTTSATMPAMLALVGILVLMTMPFDILALI